MMSRPDLWEMVFETGKNINELELNKRYNPIQEHSKTFYVCKNIQHKSLQ